MLPPGYANVAICLLSAPSYCRVLLMVGKGQVVHLLTFIQGLLINASNTKHMGEFLCICLGGVHVCAQNKEYNWDHHTVRGQLFIPSLTSLLLKQESYRASHTIYIRNTFLCMWACMLK